MSVRNDHHEHTIVAPAIIAGVGVQGDAHAGATMKHRYLVRRDSSQPNLRQVHLIHNELFTMLEAQGHRVAPGELGENITTRAVDLLSLRTGTRLKIGPDAVIELTGLRNPCVQVDDFQSGLMKKLRYRDDGGIVRIGGVMAVVLTGGEVRPDDHIVVDLPPESFEPLVYLVDSHQPTRVPGSWSHGGR